MFIKLEKIKVVRNKIYYDYQISSDAIQFFNIKHKFYIEYMTDINFDVVPQSILAIPFVTNLLPLSWIFGVEIIVDKLDEAFFNSIEKMKNGFSSIYPDVLVQNNITVTEVENNEYKTTNRTTCLFSGGVDATFSFFRHCKEDITLFNVWGVDVGIDDMQAHLEMERYFHKISAEFDVSYICIKSSIRTFYNENFLNTEAYKVIKDYWWHGAQHSIGLLSLLAPYNYINGVKVNYIASTFTKKEFDMGVKCISYPIVDNALVMANTQVYHDGYDYERIEKIKYICDVRKKKNLNLDLKVCFNYRDGKNCSFCEKCFRTMMGILIWDDEINKYGFEMKHKNALKIKNFLDTTEIGIFRWQPIQEMYRLNPTNKNIRWFKHYRFNNVGSIRSKILRIFMKIKNILKYGKVRKDS